MANEHAKCLKSFGLNISSVISSKGSKTVDKFRSLYDIEHKFLNLKDVLRNKDIWDAAIICCNEEFIFSHKNQEVNPRESSWNIVINYKNVKHVTKTECSALLTTIKARLNSTPFRRLFDYHTEDKVVLILTDK